MLTKKSLMAGLAILTLTLSGFAQAGYVKTSWKVEGDNLATLDEDTGIEWLSLTQTDNWSVNQVIAETVVGGRFEGWRLPTASEVYDISNKLFMAKYGFPEDFGSYRQVYTRVRSTTWRDYNVYAGFFGHTYYTSTRRRSYAFHVNDWPDSTNAPIILTGIDAYAANKQASDRNWVYSGFSSPTYNYDTTSTNAGVYLVSDGGTTLSSIQNPALNIQNPQAPVNVSVAGAFGIIAASGFFVLSARRRRR